MQIAIRFRVVKVPVKDALPRNGAKVQNVRFPPQVPLWFHGKSPLHPRMLPAYESVLQYVSVKFRSEHPPSAGYGYFGNGCSRPRAKKVPPPPSAADAEILYGNRCRLPREPDSLTRVRSGKRYGGVQNPVHPRRGRGLIRSRRRYARRKLCPPSEIFSRSKRATGQPSPPSPCRLPESYYHLPRRLPKGYFPVHFRLTEHFPVKCHCDFPMLCRCAEGF